MSKHSKPMNKLTIKELAPYLPYGLKVQHTSFYEFGENIVALDILESLCTDCATFEMSKHYYLTDIEDNECEIKPILRPLSDLTKEIEHNGEKFVPILVLASFLGLKNLGRYDTDGVIEYGYEQKFHDDSQRYVVDYFKDGQLGIWYDTKDGLPIDTYSSLSVINKLLEWHFDIFGLIDKALAIDINTIKK